MELKNKYSARNLKCDFLQVGKGLIDSRADSKVITIVVFCIYNLLFQY